MFLVLTYYSKLRSKTYDDTQNLKHIDQKRTAFPSSKKLGDFSKTSIHIDDIFYNVLFIWYL